MNVQTVFSQIATHPLVGVVACIVATAVIAPTVNARQIDSAQITFTNGVAYANSTPFTGREIDRFPDGKTKRTAQYRDGKLDGMVRAWYPNGELEYARSYEDGTESGTHQGWYENGEQRFEYHYRNGVAQGVSRQWYSNGRPYTLFHYENGQETGQQQMWDPDGKLRANYIIRDGRRFGLPGSTGCRGAS